LIEPAGLAQPVPLIGRRMMESQQPPRVVTGSPDLAVRRLAIDRPAGQITCKIISSDMSAA
jgi:hypothetical protein